MRRFAVIWTGQLVTLVGNAVLRFAFVVQAWTHGGQATRVVLLSICASLPQVLLSPTAGAVVDRLHKRRALQLADLLGLVTIAALTAVYLGGDLRLWMIYVAVTLLGAAAAFQYPALSSSVPLLVERAHLQRANGLLGTARSGSEILGPALAGVLIASSGLASILWVDLVSFAVALICVQVVTFTELPRDPDAPAKPRKRLLADSTEGLRHLFAQPSLRALTLVIFVVNLVMVFGYAIVTSMILARTGNDTSALATVMTSIGVGGIAGGLLVGAWGGPKRRMRGLLLGIVGMCLTSQIVMSAVHNVAAWAASMLAGALFMAVVNSTEMSIIQTKVPAERLGRVFGAVMFVAQISAPIAMAMSGLLADHVFEPQAAHGSGLVALLHPLVGTGEGAGMATMLLIAGVLGVAVAAWGMVYRPLRDIDVLLPDTAAVPPAAAESDGAPAEAGQPA